MSGNSKDASYLMKIYHFFKQPSYTRLSVMLDADVYLGVNIFTVPGRPHPGVTSSRRHLSIFLHWAKNGAYFRFRFDLPITEFPSHLYSHVLWDRFGYATVIVYLHGGVNKFHTVSRRPTTSAWGLRMRESRGRSEQEEMRKRGHLVQYVGLWLAPSN